MSQLAKIIGLTLLTLAGPKAADAQTNCNGTDLIATMAPQARAALQAEAGAVPFARGLIWQAQKGAAHMLVVGTYHLDDPRHVPLLASLAPDLAASDALLVEAGPDEQAALKRAMTTDPTLVIDPDGPPLSKRLDPETWQTFSSAMAARGVPALMAARMRPWYASVMLGIAPCHMQDMASAAAGGLDQRLIMLAGADGLPIHALEPWDTLFTLFADLPAEDWLDLIRTALAGAGQADDLAVTTANAYFDGRAWEIWLLSQQLAAADSSLDKDALDAQMALTQQALLDVRNRAWLPRMIAAADDAAQRDKGVVVAVGLLHLAGEAGVVNLLSQAGWTVTPAG